MKNKHTLYTLTMALAALPFIHMNAGAEEEAPARTQQEEIAPQEIPQQPGRADAMEKRIAKARVDLEEANTKAAQATGDEKRRADAAVKRAEDRLKEIMERADGDAERAGSKDKAREEKRPNREADPVSEEVAEPEEKTPERRPAPRDAERENKNKETTEPDESVKAAEDGLPATEPRRREGRDEPKPRPEVAVETQPDTEPKVDESAAKEEDVAVDKTTREVEARVEVQKLDLKDKDAAREMIRDLIGKESEVSRAEARRESRLQPDLRGDATRSRRDGDREDLREASAYLLRRLEGNAVQEEAPTFFRRPGGRDPSDRSRVRDGGRPHQAVHTPRYYHEGRRYVPFDSRSSVPAILLAAAALERVMVQPVNRVERIFVSGDPDMSYANELPPESYRGADAVVVSYPVSKSSMISSNDIIFAQGSTRFADAHSYDMVLALADAMKDPKLGDAKFVIEGHASAEGSYDDNMSLSQRRAESIVRDMVREGIDPERLIPVGYGESEARYPGDAAESLRSLDRNVMVFRIGADR